MALRVRRLDDAAEFHGLAPLWEEIVAQGGQTSPFLSHDWFRCCWDAVRPARSPELVIVEENGTPVAVAPMMRWTQRGRGGLPVRCLALLESPDTPALDIVTVGDRAPVVQAILGHLAGRADWDVATFQKIDLASPTLKAFEAAVPERFPYARTANVPSPYLTVTGDWERFYRGKTQRFRKTCRNIQNRLERAGRVSIEEHAALDSQSSLFGEILELSGRSWKAPEGVAIATMPNMAEFFTQLTHRATARGWLSVWVLRLDGRAIAMEYQLRAEGRVYALRADFDEAFRHVSPGSALNFAIVQSLFERGGTHEYDMGPGLNEYKLRWSSGAHETVQFRLYRRAAYSRFLHALDTVVVPLARRWRERLPGGSEPER